MHADSADSAADLNKEAMHADSADSAADLNKEKRHDKRLPDEDSLRHKSVLSALIRELSSEAEARYQNRRQAQVPNRVIATDIPAPGSDSKVVRWWQLAPGSKKYLFDIDADGNVYSFDDPVIAQREIEEERLKKGLVWATPSNGSFGLYSTPNDQVSNGSQITTGLRDIRSLGDKRRLGCVWNLGCLQYCGTSPLNIWARAQMKLRATSLSFDIEGGALLDFNLPLFNFGFLPVIKYDFKEFVTIDLSKRTRNLCELIPKIKQTLDQGIGGGEICVTIFVEICLPLPTFPISHFISCDDLSI